LDKKNKILLYKMLFYLALAFLLGVLAVVTAEAAEFGKWRGIEDHNGKKSIVGWSVSGKAMVVIWIDEDLIFRLKFHPERKLRLATFDNKHIRGMTFNSLYGYDHWIKRMIKHRHMRIWFEKDKKYEYFSLNKFSKAIRWIY